LIAQIAVLVLFVVLAIVSAKRFSGLTGTASP